MRAHHTTRQSIRKTPVEQRIVVTIPTAGRPNVVARTIQEIAKQDFLPDEVLVCVPALEEIGNFNTSELPFSFRVLTGRKGLTAQRNRLLKELRPNDIAVMLDDDFLLAPDYLKQTWTLFQMDKDVVLATGLVLADGIRGRGYDHNEGAFLLSELNTPELPSVVAPVYSGYGCNMAFRVSKVRAHNIWFDEKLPLYGWLEDLDFTRMIAAYGKVVRSSKMRGVHLGTKVGRTPGLLFGYSQIANPLYLVKKGTVCWLFAAQLVMRNILSNLLHSIKPPRHIDYRGRLSGNRTAFGDLFRGKISPERVLGLMKR